MDAPDGDVELTPPDPAGELTLPVAGELTVLPEGELWLMPVPLVAPLFGELVLLLIDPDVLLPLIEPDAPGLVVVGEADGLLEIPAACIACWLQRSKSARLMFPAPMAATGSSMATLAVTAPRTLATFVM